MLYSDKSLMIPRDKRTPAWIRKTYHKVLKRESFKQDKPITFFIDQAVGEWLRKEKLIK